ncbi:hypothetical protein DK26_24910 [Bosea sp. WAO]|uniref:hypothetical protein n=1 Tax=Bosea sp. WAO TaxID=406341 RepID=UPI000748AE56|nr:hypothetical protein [Bosea sp. WAO]KUL93006.1 hypothetical protein DK26_24910 [Bosea sp. WAO]
MPLRFVVLSLAAMMLAGGGALAQRAEVPAEVTAVREELRQQCDGKASFKPRFQSVADLNGDGLPDYLLDYGAVVCGEGNKVNRFCGSGGCTLDIFMSGAGGYRQVYGDNVRAWSIKQARGKPVLELSLHGGYCDLAGYQPCHKRLSWDGDDFVELAAR